jgi:hypothetical protein
MAIALSIPQRSYNAGQLFGPTTFSIAAGSTGMELKLTNPSVWPVGDIASLSLEVSYDNGLTWVALGGLVINGNSQGVNDEYLGLVNGASLKARYPQAANATTKGRAQASVLKTFTAAINVTSI